MSDWNKTRRNKSDTDLIYRKGWKVSITDVDTLTQWLEVNIPFPVNVTREKIEKRAIDAELNPIIISTDEKYNLEEFLPLIEESFETAFVTIKKENKFSFKIIIRRLRINDGKKSLNDFIKFIAPFADFDSIEHYNKVRDIVFGHNITERHQDFPMKEMASDLDESPSNIIDKMTKGYWVSREMINKWYDEQSKAYDIYAELSG